MTVFNPEENVAFWVVCFVPETEKEMERKRGECEGTGGR